MGSQREEPKWAHLLQPIKDLERNWDVDIAGELSDYLEDLSGLTFEVDGLANLNFAEAAMVVYSSTCTYGKKVEYLMKLTMSALEAAKARHRNGAGTAGRKKGDASSDGHLLGVLDIVDDIMKAGCKAPNLDMATLETVQIPPHVPPLLLDLSDTTMHRTVASSDTGHNGSGMEMSTAAMMSPSDAPSFNMMRCHVHASGAMLLLASDGADFDVNLNSAVAVAEVAASLAQRHPLGAPPASPTRAAAQEGLPDAAGFGSPVIGAGDADGGAAMDQGGAWFDDGDDYYGGAADGDVGAELAPGVVAGDGGAAEGGSRGRVRGDQQPGNEGAEEVIFDPFAPLDAHDASSAVNKPYKKAVPRIPKFRNDIQLPTHQPFLLPPPNALPQHLQLIFPDAVAASKRTKPRKQPAAQAFSPLLNAPGPAFQPETLAEPEERANEGDPSALEAAWMWGGMNADAHDNSDHDPYGFAFDDDGDGGGGYDEGDDMGPPEHAGAGGDDHDGFQASQGAGAAYDDLVAMYSQAVAEAASAADMQSSLSRKVSNWRSSIGSIMVEQDRRPPFDIQETGSRILEHVSDLVSTMKAPPAKGLPFHTVVRCENKYEVARSFSAFLQLVNSHKVDVLRGCGPADPFNVQLLDVETH